MSIVNQMLAFNQQFVEEKQYEQFISDKFPDKKVVILTCMDARLTELLPHALGLKTVMRKSSKMPGPFCPIRLVPSCGRSSSLCMHLVQRKSLSSDIMTAA